MIKNGNGPFPFEKEIQNETSHRNLLAGFAIANMSDPCFN